MLQIHITWEDGLDVFVLNESLKPLPHCLLSLVSFYESRIASRVVRK